ncbi:oxidosqualene:lanosterol cyclase [Poronia punctata]|nr:oxidosqualene:lanosterol cyclase [Poronia punctata]
MTESKARKPRIAENIDRTRWRLLDENGRFTWHYLEDDEAVQKWPQSMADKWYLGLDTDLPTLPKPKKPLDAVNNGLTFFEKLQLPCGEWGCEYGGPMFLLPGVVITWYATKTPIPWYVATEIKNYLSARAHPKDGGWGLHIEGESTVFGTALNYTVLRLVGVDPEDPVMVRARKTLHKLGGATHAPHWAKFWLSVLGVCKWDIVNPVPPEVWLLPDWAPFAPWRWWIHMRQVFLPMGYIFDHKWTCEETDVIRALRVELFTEDWDSIDWAGNRNTISPGDNYHPKSWLLNTANWALVNIWPWFRPNFLRNRANQWVSKLIDMEDANTDYADLAPVNAALNTVACYIRDGPGSYSVKRHIERLEDSMWVNAEGMLCNGTNGVQCWDTSFLIQAVVDAGLEQDERWRPMLKKALTFLDEQQIRDNCAQQATCYRQQRKGAWAFSNKDQGYAVCDCVSEALKAVILLQKTPGYPELLDDERIFDAVDTILTYQNPTGACSSYEPTRGSELLELLNAAEVFGKIMVEYDYVECTTAVVTALSLFKEHWPDHRSQEIDAFVARSVAWIKTAQLPDGSWYGNWAICYTYATMFALESLKSIGEKYNNSYYSKRGCDFLIARQRADGGWSESYRSCEKMVYTEHSTGSQVVMTAWALIGLMHAEYPQLEPIKKGIKLIMDRQQPNGEWKQEAIEGVFNKSCMISYPNYKFTFTMKALGMFAKKYPNETTHITPRKTSISATCYKRHKRLSNMSTSTALAAAGVEAVSAGRYDEGIEKLTTALKDRESPLWYLERSKSYLRTNQFDDALRDAEKALIIAYDRANRDQMLEAQLRRSITLFRMGYFADADICAFWAIRLADGAKATEDDGQQRKVDENGDYAAQLQEAVDASKQDKEGGLSQAMGFQNNKRTKTISLRNQAIAWRVQALTRMEKLPAGHDGRKVHKTTASKYPKHSENTAGEVTGQKEPASGPEAGKAITPASSGPEPARDDWQGIWEKYRQMYAKHKIRCSFYQTDTRVTIDIFVKNLSREQVTIEPSSKTIRISPAPGVSLGSFGGTILLVLSGEIKPQATQYNVKSMKIELVLEKQTPGKWPTLRHNGSDIFDNLSTDNSQGVGSAQFNEFSAGDAMRASSAVEKPAEPSGSKAPPAGAGHKAPSYPTSSKKGPKDWDHLDAGDDDDEDAAENGDVNSFFQKVYKGADEDTRRAMMKSFIESNGTALSTSWDDAKSKTYKTQPPDGVEARKWE